MKKGIGKNGKRKKRECCENGHDSSIYCEGMSSGGRNGSDSSFDIGVVEGVKKNEKNKRGFEEKEYPEERKRNEIESSIDFDLIDDLDYWSEDSVFGEEEKNKKEKRKNEEKEELNESHYSLCTFCQGGGNMICCDSCPRVFHKQCLKLKRVPEGHWICPICKSTNAAKCSLCNQNLSKHTSPYKLICSKCRCLMHYDCVEVPIFLLFKTCKYIQQDTTKITNSQVDVLIDYVCFDCQKNLGIQKICDVYNYQQNSPSAQPLTHNNYYFIKFENLSYLHCVWVFYDFVKEFNPRKLKNFEAKMEFSDLSELLENDNNFHGVDLDNLDVDRIIDKRLPSPKSEDFNIKYLVKWKSLQYEERSWERESYLTNFRDKIEFYEKSKRTEDSLNSGELNVSKLTDYIKNVNFTKFTEQPSFIENGHLHDYQLEGFNWLIYSWHQKNNIILADEMGLGKTIEAIAFLKYLVHCLENRGPFIICAPLSTLDNWKRELAHWFPEGNVVLYSGTQKSRHIIRLTEFFFNLKKKVKKPNLTKGKYRLCKFNILLTSYEIMLMDNQILRKFAWEALIIDEGQRLKNSCSKLYKEIIHFQTQFRMLMTGTPLQNNLSELLSLMQFISPKKFNADMQQKLLQEFNSLQLDVKSKILTGKDEREKGNEKDDSFLQVQVGDDYEDERSNQEQELINKMHKELKPHMLRRLKKDVMLEIPKKKELILRVDLSKRQREIYKCIFTRNFNALKELDKMKRKNKISIKSVANILMLLRLCTNHPLLLTRDYKGRIGEVEEYREGSEEDVDGLENNNESADGKRKTSEEKRIEKELIQESGKVLLLDKMLLKLYPAANRVLIFSQFKMMLDILEEYCEYRQFRYLRLDGNTPPLFRQKLIDQFNAPNSPYFIFLLSTRAGGLGINLASADTVFIFDSDFNPHNDLQALSRAHRIGQKNRVMIYRLVARYTVEEQIIQIAKKKLMIEHLVVKSNKSESLNKSDLDSILRFGTEKLFNEEKKDGIELNYNEEMIEHILNRGDDDEEEGSEGKEKRLNKIDDYLSAFKVADFPHLGTEKGVVKAVDEVTDVEENYWTKLLGEEYEKTIIKEQEKLGKGKRKRKYVHYDVFYDSDGSEYEGEKVSDLDSSESEQDVFLDDSLLIKNKKHNKKKKTENRRPNITKLSPQDFWIIMNPLAVSKQNYPPHIQSSFNSTLSLTQVLSERELVFPNIQLTDNKILLSPHNHFPADLLKTYGISFTEPLETRVRLQIILWGFHEINRIDFIHALMRWGIRDHKWDQLYQKCEQDPTNSLSGRTLDEFLYFSQNWSATVTKLIRKKNTKKKYFFLGNYCAEEIMERIYQIGLIDDIVETFKSEPFNFKLSHPDYEISIQKSLQQGTWSQTDDYTLLKSILRHGYGAWSVIANDHKIWSIPLPQIHLESDLSNQKSQTYPWEALIFKIQKLDLETLTHIIPEPNVPEIAQKFVEKFLYERTVFLCDCMNID